MELFIKLINRIKMAKKAEEKQAEKKAVKTLKEMLEAQAVKDNVGSEKISFMCKCGGEPVFSVLGMGGTPVMKDEENVLQFSLPELDHNIEGVTEELVCNAFKNQVLLHGYDFKSIVFLISISPAHGNVIVQLLVNGEKQLSFGELSVSDWLKN